MEKIQLAVSKTCFGTKDKFGNVVKDADSQYKGNAFENEGYLGGSSSSVDPVSQRNVEVRVIENGFHHEAHPNVPDINPKIISYNQKGDPSIIEVDAENSNNSDTSDSIEVVTEPPSNYSGPAWVSCFFCCIPLACLAVWSSDKATKALLAGDLNAAERYSQRTRKLSALAIVFGVFLIIFCVSFYVLYTKYVSHQHIF